MSTSSSSSAQAARERLADQLREMRLDAGLSGREFARRAGWRDATTVSKIERAQRPVSAVQVRLWCGICGASGERTRELLAEQASAERMWLAYRDLGQRTGLNATQKMGTGDMFERLSVMRSYQTKVIPGLLQTRDYMTGVLTGVREERHVEIDDVAEAVNERMARQRFLRMQGKRFMFVVEETVLRFRPFGVHVHREQLSHLLEVTRLPAIWFGVIPMDADREGYRPRESFDIIDSNLVTIELISGFLSLTHHTEVAMYTEAWDRLMALAAPGRRARTLIETALQALP